MMGAPALATVLRIDCNAMLACQFFFCKLKVTPVASARWLRAANMSNPLTKARNGVAPLPKIIGACVGP